MRKRLSTPLLRSIKHERRTILDNTSTQKRARLQKRPVILSHTLLRDTRTIHRPRVDICSRRATRRAVLLAIGRVNRSGGAPGPYKRHEKQECK